MLSATAGILIFAVELTVRPPKMSRCGVLYRGSEVVTAAAHDEMSAGHEDLRFVSSS